jgi:nitroreductase
MPPRVSNAEDVLAAMRKVRQARQFRNDPVPADLVHELLEVARWPGSSRHTQPWRFVVVTDKDQLKQLSEQRSSINWVADAAVAIAIALTDQPEPNRSYDEGRVTERVLIAAYLLGLGGGTAWYGGEEQEAWAKEILGVPKEMTCRSLIALGYVKTFNDARPNKNTPGRLALDEIVSYGTYQG